MFTNERLLMGRLCVATAVAAMSLHPMRLAAQSPFEGVVTFETHTRGQVGTSTLSVKGTRFRADGWQMDRDPRGGTVIVDSKGDLILGSAERKAYMRPGTHMKLDKPTYSISFTKTGRSDNVLGYKCDYYAMHGKSSDREDRDLCVTKALGPVTMIPGNPFAGVEATAQFPNGFFVLKTLDKNGNVLAVATKVERKPLSDDLFEPPADWREMGRGRP